MHDAGAACEFTGCMAATPVSYEQQKQQLNKGRPVACSGHGRCVRMADLTEETNALPISSTVVDYDASVAFDSDRIFGCVCDSSWAVGLGDGEVQEAEWFGPHCGFRHCPTGDNPATKADETNCSGINGGSANNLCLVECASQGDCDHRTGACECREGFGGENCATKLVVTEKTRKTWAGVVPGQEAGGGRVRTGV